MSEHTAMLWLPQAMQDAGHNVVVLDGWEEAQGYYFWTQPQEGTIGDFDEPPKLFMVHHTAGTFANPSVKSTSGKWSKANCWMGVMRYGALWSHGEGEPTVIFTSSGPARISSGYGHWPTAVKAMNDERVPWKQAQADGPYALNRYAWNVEVVHPGDGSEINEGVEQMVIDMGTILAKHFDWSAWRTIGHLSWTTRKIDPRWIEVDRIVYIQDQINEALSVAPEPIPPPLPPEEDEFMPPFELWIKKIRTVDIDHMAHTGIIRQSDADYFTGETMWDPVAEAEDPDAGPIVNEWTLPDWQSLYDSYRVRTPIWAVQSQ